MLNTHVIKPYKNDADQSTIEQIYKMLQYLVLVVLIAQNGAKGGTGKFSGSNDECRWRCLRQMEKKPFEDVDPDAEKFPSYSNEGNKAVPRSLKTLLCGLLICSNAVVDHFTLPPLVSPCIADKCHVPAAINGPVSRTQQPPALRRMPQNSTSRSKQKLKKNRRTIRTRTQ